MKLIDLTGKRFRYLVVISRVESQRTERTLITQWLCRCDCGREHKVTGSNLKSGKVQTCHHALCPYARAVSNHAGEGVSARRHVFSMYKGRSEHRGLVFTLTRDEFFALIIQDCYYCGTNPSNTSRQEPGSGVFLYNGVDRLDSKLGYVTDNVRPCCWTCNQMKRTLTEMEFKEHINKIHAHMMLEIRGGS